MTLRRHLQRWRNLFGLLHTLTAPAPQLAWSSVALLEEYERIAGELSKA